MVLLGLGALHCGGESGDKAPIPPGGDDTASPETGAPDTAEPEWGESISVRVTDPDGAELAGVWVMMGGWSKAAWVATDADGAATIPLVDDGWGDLFVLAGAEGRYSAGGWLRTLPPNEVVDLVLEPLPSEDNPDYHFQKGGDGSSPDTSECGHCHWTIGDDWASSAHAEAGSNPRTWDLYTGSQATDAATCESLGGWMADGQSPGEVGVAAPRCYLGEGVLPWLNEGCGEGAGVACDHPDARAGLSRFGSCGDCHTPATDGGVPGQINLADAHGVAREGVTCDFCHKVQSVTPGPQAGLDGGISLLRPSLETVIPGQDFDPITFGPYPDVIVPIMNGTYTPQFTESSWCAGCHEYSQPALHPDESLLIDTVRWPDGLPVHQTWSEYQVWAGESESAMTCQGCHMQALLEESSTYDISPTGLAPSVDQGWLRAVGEVRHHDFPASGVLSAPALELGAEELEGGLVATVTVKNQMAGHAVPSGEPMGQLLVVLEAKDSAGEVVPAIGGQVVPNMGGHIALGTVDEDLSVVGSVLTLPGAVLDGATAVRIARPTGEWVDYAGPGVGWFSEPTTLAADKGLRALEFIEEILVVSADGESAVIAHEPADLLPGDQVFITGPGQLAGVSGWLYAKTLVDGAGRIGVAHYRAVDIGSDNRIAPRGEGVSLHRFALPGAGESVTITVTLIKRRYQASVADRYGWDVTDTVVRTEELSFAR